MKDLPGNAIHFKIGTSMSHLFSEFKLSSPRGPLSLANRIVIAPIWPTGQRCSMEAQALSRWKRRP